MPDEANLRTELREMNAELGDVKISVARIEESTKESNRRLESIENEIKHDLKTIRMAMQAIPMLKDKIDGNTAEIAALKTSKADADDLAALKKRVDVMEEKVQQIIWRTLSAVGVAVLTYVAQKLGITIPGLKP
ncbi:hypothetical protein FF100_22025 [Methylobacterium terricola]|uniref:Uncharacterized protein n=1 Tax=Methylobacterium terricola TaxID=2583531 RepID=A0A5C4LDL7_9HYPH|nr:hypothetical protein [Methylobacterium terricola]TNC10831.1 hypothetical protein FF100_22025 [Methylobacterium terricola]